MEISTPLPIQLLTPSRESSQNQPGNLSLRKRQLMIDLIRALMWSIGAIVAIGCATIAYKVWRGDHVEYSRNRQRSTSLKAVLRGEVPSLFDGDRDYRAAAGIVVDETKNEWKENGRLSEEAVSSTTQKAPH